MDSKRRQELMEELEEARFALLMDDYAEAEGRRILLEYERDREEIPEELNGQLRALIDRELPARSRRPWQRALMAAAAMVVCVCTVTMMASRAVGYDVFEIIGKWTDDSFHFGPDVVDHSVSEPQDYLTYESLQEALIDNQGSIFPVVPTWLPDGYSEGAATYHQTSETNTYYVTYTKEEDTIELQLVEQLRRLPAAPELTEDYIDCFKDRGVEYYIFDRGGNLEAFWRWSSFECSLSAPVEYDEMIQILDSIMP